MNRNRLDEDGKRLLYTEVDGISPYLMSLFDIWPTFLASPLPRIDSGYETETRRNRAFAGGNVQLSRMFAYA